MHNKFLRTSIFLGMLVLSSVPAKSVQRFAMNEDSLYISIDDKRVPTSIRTLTWRGVQYEPLPNRRAKGWLEWNVAPDNTPGPTPIYGEKVDLMAHTDYDNMHYSCCCIPYTVMETGHPKNVHYTAQLLLSGNPECVILYWGNSGFAAISKEDYANRDDKKAKPLLQNVVQNYTNRNDEVKPLLKSAVQSNVQKEIKAVEEWVESLPQEEINVRSFQINLRAAEQGDTKSQVLLAHCYHLGTGVTKDPTQAVYWYRKAAEQGDEGAKKILLSRYKIN